MPYKDKSKQQQAQREWAHRNRDITNKHKRKSVQKLRKLAYEHFEKNPCADCGESDPIVLEFDHLPSKGKKLNNVSTLIGQGRSKQLILDEIAKCEVRCANCHRRKTALRANWYPWRN